MTHIVIVRHDYQLRGENGSIFTKYFNPLFVVHYDVVVIKLQIVTLAAFLDIKERNYGLVHLLFIKTLFLKDWKASTTSNYF